MTNFTMEQIINHLVKNCGFKAYKDEDGEIYSLDKKGLLTWTVRTAGYLDIVGGIGKDMITMACINLNRDEVLLVNDGSIVVNHVHFNFK